jgi:hypothetical protein
MAKIVDVKNFKRASSGCVVRLLAQPHDTHPFYADYDTAVLAVDAIANLQPVHISGASGVGKSHFLNSLLFGPGENFERICQSLNTRQWARRKCHRVFVSMYETPAEVWYRTKVINFTCVDEPQEILRILAEAVEDDEDTLHVVWLVESGRGITEAVQGGFLEVIGQSTIREPKGQVFELSNVAFVTDSNHAANTAGEFAIFDLDQAYGRRFTRRITFRGLSPDQEVAVLKDLVPEATEEQIAQVVSSAMGIRQKHKEGSLRSILPATIDAELDLLSCMRRLPLNDHALVFNTLLGHCAERDAEDAEAVYAEAFGVQVKSSTPVSEAVGVL